MTTGVIAKPKRTRRMARSPKSPSAAESMRLDPDSPSDPQERASTSAEPDGREGKSRSKISMVIDLLDRPQGATLDELVEVTGWLPHTVRASLTGLRKKGHQIARTNRDGASCYTIVTAVGA